MTINSLQSDASPAEDFLHGVATVESIERWQTAITAIGRRAALANGGQLASDSAAALAAALEFDMSGATATADDGALTLTLAAARLGVHASPTPFPVSEHADDSLIGCALAAGKPIATEDLREETRYRDATLRTRQIRAALAVPLHSNGRVYGALLVASLTPHLFSPQDLLCAETIGHLVGGALSRERAERMLEEQVQINAAVSDGVDAIIVTLDSETRLLHINRNGEQLTGFKLAEVRQRPFRGAFLTPATESAVTRQLDQLLRDRRPAAFDSLLITKHGAERRVAWRFIRLDGGRGAAALVGAGFDVTEKCELGAKLAKVRTGLSVETNASQTPPKSLATTDGQEDVVAEDDRRVQGRRAYPYKQQVAAIRDGQMPGLSDFREVDCHDIGGGGFSYFVATEPTETDVVVAFGAGPSQTYLTARVVHAKPTTHKGQPMFLVGCCYTGRHAYS